MEIGQNFLSATFLPSSFLVLCNASSPCPLLVIGRQSADWGPSSLPSNCLFVTHPPLPIAHGMGPSFLNLSKSSNFYICKRGGRRREWHIGIGSGIFIVPRELIP